MRVLYGLGVYRFQAAKGSKATKKRAKEMQQVRDVGVPRAVPAYVLYIDI